MENKQTTFTIERKMSGTGSIHDIASDQYTREIVFAPGCKYAVVLAAFYGGKGYTTHKTAEAALEKSRKLKYATDKVSHIIIDTEGNHLTEGPRGGLVSW